MSHIYPLCVSCPSETFVNFFVFKHIHALALTQSLDNLFQLFIVLYANKYFLISGLHCSFTNTALCHLVLLKFEENMYQYLHNHSIKTLVFDLLLTSFSLEALNHILLCEARICKTCYLPKSSKFS